MSNSSIPVPGHADDICHVYVNPDADLATAVSLCVDLIVTVDEKIAGVFIPLIDSASVFWNALTRFADGFRHGIGAEVGLSTNKIHARSPVGLDGPVIYNHILLGRGETVTDYANGARHFKHTPMQKHW